MQMLSYTLVRAYLCLCMLTRVQLYVIECLLARTLVLRVCMLFYKPKDGVQYEHVHMIVVCACVRCMFFELMCTCTAFVCIGELVL